MTAAGALAPGAVVLEGGRRRSHGKAWCTVTRPTVPWVLSGHFTLRFQAGTTERLQRRARAAGTPPRSLATRYVEEGLRHDDHPLIHFVDGETGRRAALIGTKLDVWEVIATVRDSAGDTCAAADYLNVLTGLVEAAVAYYGDFHEEIDEEIALNETESERGRVAWERGQRAIGRRRRC